MWDSDTVQRLSNLSMANCSTLSDDKLVMVGYDLELGYSLMINDKDNMSRTTGFEEIRMS